MHNYEHKKLIDAIHKLDKIPDTRQEFSEWIKAEAHLAFLKQNVQANELVIFASGDNTYIYSVVVSNEKLFPVDQASIVINWGVNPNNPIASYVMGGRKDIWIESASRNSSSHVLENSIQLIFRRTFNGWTGQGRNYYELHQEYSHLN